MLHGVTGRSLGRSPLAFVEPTTVPPLTPPPPSRQQKALPQWSRPGVPWDIGAPPLPPSFIFGVRPNSPQSTTRVSSNRPRSSRSVNRAETRLSTIGRLFSYPFFRSQWWSHPPRWTVTNVHPASASRRASSVLWPHGWRP